MGANLVHQSYRMTSSKCYTCKIARLMANLTIFSTLWSFSQFFQKYATFSLFFDNPSRSVFFLRFMSKSQTKFFFFIFIPLFSWVVVKITILPNLAPLLTPCAWLFPTLEWFYYNNPSWVQRAQKKRFKKWFSLILRFFKVGWWFFHFWPFGGKKTPFGGVN